MVYLLFVCSISVLLKDFKINFYIFYFLLNIMQPRTFDKASFTSIPKQKNRLERDDK
jgi:hypothetical protein